MASIEATEDDLVIERCRVEAIALLKRNLAPGGILAATPSPLARSRGYTAIFARDAAVCAIGMALSGDALLEREAATALLTLARHQAPNGQIPKFVDPRKREVDFWYLGCIDATLWWLLGLAFLDHLRPAGRLRSGLEEEVRKAIQWSQCQEHQRFHLLQQNEASDWADIMPRSGFVLYSNALWHLVKRVYGLPHAAKTRRNANDLFHPLSSRPPQYPPARPLLHYVRATAPHRPRYLSFVKFFVFLVARGVLC